MSEATRSLGPCCFLQWLESRSTAPAHTAPFPSIHRGFSSSFFADSSLNTGCGSHRQDGSEVQAPAQRIATKGAVLVFQNIITIRLISKLPIALPFSPNHSQGSHSGAPSVSSLYAALHPHNLGEEVTCLLSPFNKGKSQV